MNPVPDQYRKVNGHIKLSEAEYLYNAPFRLGGGYYGDIGTLYGRSAVYVAGGIKDSGVDGKVITIDHHDKVANKTFEKNGVGSQVVSIIKDSVEASQNYVDKSFRLVFIDASHHYLNVKADFEAWSPKVAEDGELAFHDSNVEGVKKLLEEVQADEGWHQVGLAYTLSWWKRC